MTRRNLFARLLAAAGFGTGLVASVCKEKFATATLKSGVAMALLDAPLVGPRNEWGAAVITDGPIVGELVD